MANLRDISNLLGISVSTVSRALNDSDDISEETKRKVHDAAVSLGYTLRGRGKKTLPEWNTAGIIVPEVKSEYYARIVHISQEMLAARGYSSFIRVTNFSANEMVDAINCMSRIHVKRLLIVMDDNEVMSERILRAIRNCRLAVLLINTKYIPMLEFDSIYLDEYCGIMMAVQHLKDRGYQRIGCIGEKLTVNRTAIFKQVKKILDLESDPQLVCTGSERAEMGGYLRMKELLALPEPPGAVFCAYDQMAIGAIHALKESGKRIPEDVAIVGFDDITVSQYIAGGITTVGNPYDDMISIAVNVLTKRQQNPQSSWQQIALQPKLLIRATT